MTMHEQAPAPLRAAAPESAAPVLTRAEARRSRKFSRKDWRSIGTALLFLGPNVAGFLAFTLVPLLLSFVLAFSNWDLKLHNMFKSVPLEWVGFAQFSRLFASEEFLKFLGNTLFLMMTIPLGMAGSLGAALLLNSNLGGKTPSEGKRIARASLVAAGLLLIGVLLLWSVGAIGSILVVVLGGIAALVLVGASHAGITVYRTLFYLPHFTSGVAVFLLWKKLYSPLNGPINAALTAPLAALSSVVSAIPTGMVRGLALLLFAGIVAIMAVFLTRLGRLWRDGEAGLGSIVPAAVLTLLPIACAWLWAPDGDSWVSSPAPLLTLAAIAVLTVLAKRLAAPRDFTCSPGYGAGTVVTLAALCMTVEFVLLGVGIWVHHLPELVAPAAGGLTPPNWLTDYHWAKPAIMIMGLWAAIGSNNMLLYLAGLTNIPQELYEAADIDGAKPLQRFWHVTWPQLAPVTFFIFVMSVIFGLQGGFEMARTMTQGGPAGATTTLAYYIYTEGFQQGRLGFASAVAWTLFAMVFVMTMVNWKFGSRYVNE